MRTEDDRRKVEAARKKGDVHLRFCALLYREQMRNGRYFVHEHPERATSWKLPSVQGLWKESVVQQVIWKSSQRCFYI